jgi:hypothetical protein
MPPRERHRQLEKVLAIIEHHQRRNAHAAACHDKTRRRKLRKAGIDLRKVRRCPPWF